MILLVCAILSVGSRILINLGRTVCHCLRTVRWSDCKTTKRQLESVKRRRHTVALPTRLSSCGMTCINLLFSVFVVDVLLCQSVGIAIVFSVAVVVSFTVCVDVFVVANCFFFCPIVVYDDVTVVIFLWRWFQFWFPSRVPSKQRSIIFYYSVLPIVHTTWRVKCVSYVPEYERNYFFVSLINRFVFGWPL